MLLTRKKKSVTAILEGTEFDAVNRINNRLRNANIPWYIVTENVHPELIMPNKFVATVKCDERDVFSVEFGRDRAKKVVMDNYYKSMNKRIHKCAERIKAMHCEFCDGNENNA